MSPDIATGDVASPSPISTGRSPSQDVLELEVIQVSTEAGRRFAFSRRRPALPHALAAERKAVRGAAGGLHDLAFQARTLEAVRPPRPGCGRAASRPGMTASCPIGRGPSPRRCSSPIRRHTVRDLQSDGRGRPGGAVAGAHRAASSMGPFATESWMSSAGPGWRRTPRRSDGSYAARVRRRRACSWRSAASAPGRRTPAAGCGRRSSTVSRVSCPCRRTTGLDRCRPRSAIRSSCARRRSRRSVRRSSTRHTAAHAPTAARGRSGAAAWKSLRARSTRLSEAHPPA